MVIYGIAPFHMSNSSFEIRRAVKTDTQYFSDVVFENDQVYVACDRLDQSIVGFIAFNELIVSHLYLAPEVIGRGLGGSLLELAKRQGRTLHLWAFQRNETAKNFYIKHGFTVVQQTDGSDNEEHEPDILFEWSCT